ncbi:glycosyltransferase [Flavobacterium suncheonense]|uniref:Glycosyl transferase family 1 domain-containing protein n=1 Tax=Flavobacterium suncheonense GH29-5 = DSM 17707 TaxID=1121899 RepID=A0A0A2MCM0_9FLAO|nr:glycosyltransferase [Flavobacterium suncheonense]KGO89381.1 hypothetical protein Q764_08350 [Flavobacterium suncheonense GH29-5 = DSM 17707]
MQKILFITWDGPQTSYMEGLFLPIFNAIKKTDAIDFHVIQFTWADQSKTDSIRKIADSFGIHYAAYKIQRKPIALLGSLFTLFQGKSFLQQYIDQHKIDVVMPRSTMPAVMVNRLRLKNTKIIFDADGLPLEERVDFSGLSKASKQYQWLKKEETRLLIKADGVLTRSQKAIAIHLKTIGNQFHDKFTVVFNGRNPEFFQPYASQKTAVRKMLGIPEDDFVFVYCGSLGPQYGWEEMLTIFKSYHTIKSTARFLIVSGNPEFVKDKIPEELQNSIIVKSVPFAEVPKFLSAADVAFAIRKPTFSMQGVAPIKLGEYLLMGLPTIASAGIGDTETLLENVPGTFLFEHNDAQAIEKAVTFVANLKYDPLLLREAGEKYFSLKKSAESYRKAFQKL